MNLIKQPKTWLVITLMAAMLMGMILIVKRYNAVNEIQQKIDDHSEIKDTI